MKPVIVVGHAALDHVWHIEDYPPRPTKIRALAHFESGGGMAANAAAAIGRLGGPVELWSRIGADNAGEKVLSFLAADNVDTAHVRRFAGHETSCAAIIVDSNGERLAVGARDLDMPTECDWLPLDRIAGASAVLSDFRWIEGTRAAFETARAKGVPTVADADFEAGSLLNDLLSLTDFAIFPAGSLAAFAPELDDEARLARVLALGPRHAGVTRGPGGYLWANGSGETGFVPAVDVRAVDTTGAGDAFHGAFTWALGQGYPEAACARIAAFTAALKCRKPGARAGLPTLAEIAPMLDQLGRRTSQGQDY